MKKEITNEIKRLLNGSIKSKLLVGCPSIKIKINQDPENIGTMDYFFLSDVAYLSFSSFLWESLSKYQKKQAIVHEFCHAIIAYKYRYANHGIRWKKLMKKFGRKPSIRMRVYD